MFFPKLPDFLLGLLRADVNLVDGEVRGTALSCPVSNFVKVTTCVSCCEFRREITVEPVDVPRQRTDVSVAPSELQNELVDSNLSESGPSSKV